MSTHEITEPLFITEEIEAEMIAAGYVIEVPKLITLPHDYNNALEPEEGSVTPLLVPNNGKANPGLRYD